MKKLIRASGSGIVLSVVAACTLAPASASADQSSQPRLVEALAMSPDAPAGHVDEPTPRVAHDFHLLDRELVHRLHVSLADLATGRAISGGPSSPRRLPWDMENGMSIPAGRGVAFVTGGCTPFQPVAGPLPMGLPVLRAGIRF